MNQQTIVCNNCKTPNPARNLYCQSCGRPLIAASPYPTYPTSPDATQPVGGQPPAPVVPPPYTPPPEYTPPPAPEQPEYTPPPPQLQEFVPPAPQQPMYTPPPPQPQYPQPPAAGSAPTYPPQPGVQPTYAAPAPYPPAPAQPDFFQKTQARAGSFVNAMKKETTNVHADGWSDLVAGEGEKAAEIEKGFVEEMTGRGLTNVDMEQVELVSGLQGRTYQVARHRAGSVSMYASSAGKDLMLGWELNLVQKPSWKRMGILLLAAAIVAFLVSLINGSPFVYFLGQWISGTIGWCFNITILGLIAGMVMKGDIWYMFIEKADATAKQELAALAMAVHQSLATAVKNAGLDETALRRKDKFKMG